MGVGRFVAWGAGLAAAGGLAAVLYVMTAEADNGGTAFAEVDPRVFKDDAPANARVEAGSFPSSFVDCAGKPVDLAAFRGKKNLVVVVIRGYNGNHCLYCTAQTKSLFGKAADLAKYDAQLLLVYPGKADRLDELLVRAGASLRSAPAPVLLDEDFKAVDALGIRGALAKPSTYVLDKMGEVRYAYVGSSLSDRPSVKAILDQLARLTG